MISLKNPKNLHKSYVNPIKSCINLLKFLYKSYVNPMKSCKKTHPMRCPRVQRLPGTASVARSRSIPAAPTEPAAAAAGPRLRRCQRPGGYGYLNQWWIGGYIYIYIYSTDKQIDR
jgi:hypothetical protein